MNIPRSSIRETERGQDGKQRLQAARSPHVPNGAPPASRPCPLPAWPSFGTGVPSAHVLKLESHFWALLPEAQ